MSFEIEFKNLLNTKGLEAIKNNFMFFSILNDSKGKTRIDVAKIKMFYMINSYLNLYNLISNNEISTVFQNLKLFIEQNPLNYSTINTLICLEPLMNFVDKTAYDAFVQPYLKQNKNNTVKVVKQKKQVVQKKKELQENQPLEKQVILNVTGSCVYFNLSPNNDFIVNNCVTNKSKTIVPKNKNAQILRFNINCKSSLTKIFIPEKYIKNLSINFDGKMLYVIFGNDTKSLASLSLNSNSNHTSINGVFDKLDLQGKGSIYLNAFAINCKINGYIGVDFFIRGERIRKLKKLTLQIKSSIIKLKSYYKFYPNIHTRLKRFYSIQKVFKFMNYDYDLDINSNYKKIIIK